MNDDDAWQHALNVLLEVSEEAPPDWRSLLASLSKRDLERVVRALAYQACMVADELTQAQGGGTIADVVASIRTHTTSFQGTVRAMTGCGPGLSLREPLPGDPGSAVANRLSERQVSDETRLRV